MNHKTSVLYSFRRCPYAMRARMALHYANIPVEIREVDLKNKPTHMLQASPKGTVPVMILADGQVIDQSLDIMQWALAQNDPDHWLPKDEYELVNTQNLIHQNDTEFKTWLDRYKYADRYPEHTELYYRQQAEQFLLQLESQLTKHRYLLSERLSFADIALLPFVRQFAQVDRNWFDQAQYQQLRQWLEKNIALKLFHKVMQKID